MNDLYPLRLEAALWEKPWGVENLGPFFGVQPHPVGEVWYTHSSNRVANGPLAGRTVEELTAEYGPRLLGAARPAWLREGAGLPGLDAYFPILAKLLFVSEKLSVQVHPPNDYALRVEGSFGKTEMWHVVSAEPGAGVAVGLTEPLDREALIQSAVSGEIERYLNWVPVRAGETIFVPAGLIHTIGPGVTICEIQQHSDLTYRLFDFGRRDRAGNLRELHLKKAADVARPELGHGTPATIELEPPPGCGSSVKRRLLSHCEYFAAERLEWRGGFEWRPDAARFELLVVLSGEGRIGDEAYRPGAAFLAPADAEPFEIEADGETVAVRAYSPDPAALEAEIETASRARVS